MTTSPPVVRVTGPGRNCGKTWLAEHLVAELTGRGYAVGAVKRSHHPLPADKPQSDSERLASAGAIVVALDSPDGLLIRRPGGTPALGNLGAWFAGQADVIVVEGFRDDRTGIELKIVPNGPPGPETPIVCTDADGSPIGLFVAAQVREIATAVEHALGLPEVHGLPTVKGRREAI